jgi:hypothetical protein
MTKNIGESVRSRLKNIAVKEGSDFNAVLTCYGLERLLYRIGESEYSTQFLLKGALLFNLWYDMPHRPTKDIDLLGIGDNDLALPIRLTDEFANDPTRESMWKAFLRKNELEQKSLIEVISVIKNLIQMPFSLEK